METQENVTRKYDNCDTKNDTKHDNSHKQIKLSLTHTCKNKNPKIGKYNKSVNIFGACGDFCIHVFCLYYFY